MIYLLIASLIWSISFGLIKHVLAGLDSNFVAFVRLSLSFLLFAPFLRPGELRRGVALQLVLTGMVQFGVMYMVYILSFRYLAAYQVAMFTIFTPLYVTLVHDFEGRRFHPSHLAAALLAVVGSGIMVARSGNLHGILTGFLLVQISNLCFAFGQVHYRRLKARLTDLSDAGVFGLLYLGALSVTIVPAALSAPWSAPALDRYQLAALLYLGLVPSGVCFFIWNVGATRTSAALLAVFNNVKIPFAVAASLLFFGEEASLPRLLAGGIVIAVALLLAARVDPSRIPQGKGA